MPAPLVALIVEDAPAIADVLRRHVEALGHTVIHATTLADVREAIDRGGYDYVLLDMQIPAKPGEDESVECGKTALEWLRAKDSRRNEAGRHLLQILVISAASREPSFVTLVHEMDADAFIAKADGLEVVPEKIRAALARAGIGGGVTPGEAANVAAQKEPIAPAPLTIAVGAERGHRTNGVSVNGMTCWLPDAVFVVFLGLLAAHGKRAGTWVEGYQLGLEKRSVVPSRIRKACAGALNEEIALIEKDGNGCFRLNPAARIDVKWGELERHPLAEVGKMASGAGRR